MEGTRDDVSTARVTAPGCALAIPLRARLSRAWCLTASGAVWNAIDPCEIVLIEPRADRAPDDTRHSPDAHALLRRALIRQWQAPLPLSLKPLCGAETKRQE